ncbi:MAG TPA: DNA helicase PcrA [Coriobacteriia bacterium]|jgi:DNA helicase-2/ATP-dependent DNA helicase PcrA
MTSLLDDLNPAQRDAVLTTEGPLLVLAGAGSGKTRVLTFRVAHLIQEHHVSPDEILAITFTNKAAAEMKERLAGLIGPPAQRMWVMTFHAMCVRMLRRDGERLGFGRSFTIYDDDDSKRLMNSVFTALELDPKKFSPAMVRGRISAAKNELVDAEAFAAAAKGFIEEKTAQCYEIYEQRLRDANAMDFDDLLVNAHTLLAEHPDVLEHYQKRFRYIHVDEYQDTNHAQYEIVNMLASAKRNLMVVGDDDQSVYSWRGADIRNILEFEQDYPDAAVIKLEQNYRSTKTILAAANYVVANNRGRKPKTLWTANAEGESITRYVATDERDEARFVAGEIERLLHDEHRGYSDFAVFYRTNAQSRVLEEIFLREGLPYKLVGGTRFFERAEIRDVLAYLRVLVNPADAVSFKRVVNTPKRGIGETTVQAIEAASYRDGVSMYEAALAAPEAGYLGTGPRKKVAEFVTLLGELEGIVRSEEKWGMRALVEAVVERSGLVSALNAERSDEAAGRVENVREFFGVVQEFEETHAEATLDDLMEWVALRTDLDALSEKEHSVTLMTLHTAKGLEWPVVFVVGMEDSLFPHANSIFEPEKLEEERRLAYVGITRARERLYLTHATQRFIMGKTQYNQPSMFIREIPEEHVATLGVGSAGYAGRLPLSAPVGGRTYGGGGMGVPRERISPKADPETFEPGDAVEHKTFGRGVVTEVKGDKVTISFTQGGTKTLLAGYAPIRKLS